MDVIKGIHLATRFLLEICVLLAVGYWGFKTGSGTLLKIVLGIGGPSLIAVIWGSFGAPKSTFQLQGILFLALEVVVFGSGFVALFLTKNYSLAWVFAAMVIINKILLVIWRQ